MPTPFDVNVPNVAQALLGFQRARKLGDDRQTSQQNRELALEKLGLLKSGQQFSQENALENRAFRESQAQRSQSNADRSFGLQKQALESRVPALTFEQRKELASAKKGPATGKPTERKVGNFAARMIDAEGTLRKLGPQIDNLAAANAPEGLANFMRSKKGQRYRQAAMQWVRAQLRKESGAVIGADEAEEEFRTYFPVLGDSPATIAQKQQARITIINNTRDEAGAGFSKDKELQSLIDSLGKTPQAQSNAPAPAGPALAGGDDFSTTSSGVKFRVIQQ